MAKRKTAKAKTKDQEQASDKSTQFTLRLKSDVYESLKATAEKADVSMNQLIQGFCEAAIETVQVGEAVRGSQGRYTFRNTPGCLCFGEFGENRYQYKGEEYSDIELIQVVGHTTFEKDPTIECLGCKANIWFGLDFSGRAVRRY